LVLAALKEADRKFYLAGQVLGGASAKPAVELEYRSYAAVDLSFAVLFSGSRKVLFCQSLSEDLRRKLTRSVTTPYCCVFSDQLPWSGPPVITFYLEPAHEPEAKKPREERDPLSFVKKV
jgi:hypothetical protein